MEDHGRDARNRLMKAAIELFAEKGYSATSVREIVRRAEVSNPVLYYHFNSKEGLFLAALAEAERDFLARLEESLHGRSLEERVVSILETYFDFANENPEYVRIGFQALFGPKGSHPEFKWSVFIEKERSILAKVFQGSDPNASLEGAALEDAVLYLQAVVTFITIRRALGRIDKLDRAYAQRTGDYILMGLLSREGESKEQIAEHVKF